MPDSGTSANDFKVNVTEMVSATDLTFPHYCYSILYQSVQLLKEICSLYFIPYPFYTFGGIDFHGIFILNDPLILSSMVLGPLNFFDDR